MGVVREPVFETVRVLSQFFFAEREVAKMSFDSSWNDDKVLQGKAGLLELFERDVLGGIKENGDAVCAVSTVVNAPETAMLMLAAYGTPEQCFRLAINAMTRAATEIEQRRKKAERRNDN